SSLPHFDLRNEGLEILNLEWLMQQGDDLLGEDPTRRINQAIDAYSDLLKNLSELQKAYKVLEGLRDTIEPDALTMLRKAEIFGMLGDARAEMIYEKAIDLATHSVRRFPGIMVKCLLEYAKFLSRRGHPEKQPDEFYAKAAEYERYAP